MTAELYSKCSKLSEDAGVIFLICFCLCVRACVCSHSDFLSDLMPITVLSYLCQRLSSLHHHLLLYNSVSLSLSLLLPSTGSEVFPVSRRAANEDVEDAHPPTGCVQVLIYISFLTFQLLFQKSVSSIICGLHT